MLYLFDLDGTLIESYMNTPDRDYNQWDLLPRRRDTLQQLQADGHTLGIVTNQGGVAFGHVSQTEAEAKIAEVKRRLGLPELWVAVCYADRRGKPPYNKPRDAARRKPSGAMIREAIAAFPQAAASGVLYVGDRPEDQQAAHDASVSFQWAERFFDNSLGK